MSKQLAYSFELDDFVEVVDEEKTEEKTEEKKPEKVVKECKHNIIIKSFKRDYVSYCTKCGKILSVRHKKGGN